MKRHPSIEPSHPGAHLVDALPYMKITKCALAKLLDVSRPRLNAILAEKSPITPAIAVRLSACVGSSAELWLNLQSSYDLWHAGRAIDVSEIKRIEVLPERAKMSSVLERL